MQKNGSMVAELVLLSFSPDGAIAIGLRLWSPGVSRSFFLLERNISKPSRQRDGPGKEATDKGTLHASSLLRRVRQSGGGMIRLCLRLERLSHCVGGATRWNQCNGIRVKGGFPALSCDGW
eukprot:GSA25T00026877001.1